MSKTKIFSIRLDEATHRALKQKALDDDIPMQQIIIKMIKEILK
jgi:predicted HicB family RNase H-like nuclease